MKNLIEKIKEKYPYKSFDNDKILCIQGDCLDVMKDIDNKSVNLIITDPPYLYNDYSKGNKGFDEKEKNIKEIFNISKGFDINKTLDEFQRILKHLNIFCFCSQKQISDIMAWGTKKYQKNILIWKKGGRPFGITYLHDIEFITHFRETGSPFNGAYKSRVFNILSKREYGHPTEKPLLLFKKLIIYGSNENDLIYDGFAGSFTTAIACIQTNRRCICVEREEEYYLQGIKRIKEDLKQGNLF